MFIKVKNSHNNKETYINVFNFSFMKSFNNILLFKKDNELYELAFKTEKAREEFINRLINNNSDVK